MTGRMETTSIDVDQELVRAVNFGENSVDVGMLADIPEDLGVVDGYDAAIDEVVAVPG
jgi:hypothetical protein